MNGSPVSPTLIKRSNIILTFGKFCLIRIAICSDNDDSGFNYNLHSKIPITMHLGKNVIHKMYVKVNV